MRIVISDHLGHAPQVHLSRSFAARGHDVLHLYSRGAQTAKADLRRLDDDAPGLRIEGLDPGSPPGLSFLSRCFQQTQFGRRVARRAMEFDPDIVVGCNNPLDVQRGLQRSCLHRNIAFVYWMQDFYAVKIDAELAERSPALSIAAGSYYHWLERSLLQRSNAVVAITHDYLGILAETWDVHDRQCMVVPNWAPLDKVKQAPKVNPWSRAHNLADKKVVLYTGALNAMEDRTAPPQLARILGAMPGVQIVVVSEGEGANWIADEARSRGLANLTVLPYQPYECFGEMLAAADVLIGLVAEHAGILYAPSKVSSYLCAGRPIVLAAPWQNVAAQLVRESGGGSVVAAGNLAALSEAVLAYLNDDELRHRVGKQARRYAEQSFDIAKITDRFERLFERLHTGPPRRRQQSMASGAVAS